MEPPALALFSDGLGQTSDFGVSGHIHISKVGPGRTRITLSHPGAPDVHRPGIAIAGQRDGTARRRLELGACPALRDEFFILSYPRFPVCHVTR